MRKIFVVAIAGAALILIWAFFVRHIGIEYRLEATPELVKIITVPDKALSTMGDEISAFAKENNFRLAMRGGFQKYELLAELTRDDVNLIVTNPFTDPHEVHFYAYRVPNSQIAKTEMGALLNRLECKVLASCK